MITPTLRELRYNRTRASNRVRDTLRHLLTDPAPTLYDGLPSWWPFWSDVLRRLVRDAVRAARELDARERCCCTDTRRLECPVHSLAADDV